MINSKQIALVTGSSKGIGQAISKLFALEFAKYKICFNAC